MRTKGYSMQAHEWTATHHMTGTRIYSIWRDMKKRCNNPKCNNFKYYGARGISVCEEWQNDFISFYHWASTNGYRTDLTLDRINNDGNYEPSNCRWATKSIQGMSMRHKNTSGYVGVSKHTNGKHWYGRVKIDGKCFYTGMSLDIHEAAKMRNDFIIKNKLPNKLNKIGETA